MASYLRRVKTTIHNRNKHHKPANDISGVDLSTAVESPLSVSTRHSFYHEKEFDAHCSTTASPVTELRRRLARKASTISLRTKSRKGVLHKRRSIVSASQADEGNHRQVIESVTNTSLSLPPPLPPKPVIHELSVIESTPSRQREHQHQQRNFSRPHSQTQERHRQPGTSSWVRMSVDPSPPPIPFLKLKEIATEVFLSHYNFLSHPR